MSGIRDAEHYRQMMQRNASANVGASLAAHALEASDEVANVCCESDTDYQHALQDVYGQYTPAVRVLQLMGSPDERRTLTLVKE